MGDVNKISLSDDEDLEALRLAALQSLKKKNTASNGTLYTTQPFNYFSQHNEYDHSLRRDNRLRGGFPSKRGRFFGGRGARNGQFHNRIRSSNLISITPVGVNEENEIGHFESSSNSKLSLPQDRYCGSGKSKENKTDESSSKFDRYNDSGKSDEESEDENLNRKTRVDSPMKLERSDSLEALMQELDDEIQGRSKPKEENHSKVKARSKRKKVPVRLDEVIKDESGEEEFNPHENVQFNKQDGEIVTDKLCEPSKLLEVLPNPKLDEEEPHFKKRRHSPPNNGEFRNYRGKPRNFRHSPTYQKAPFLPLHYAAGEVPPVYNTAFGPPNLIKPTVNATPFYDRPLSPLLINAETLQNQTMAPLSPRSAAFVLENRAIIEKRKRSPRRSYSRSPSPRRRSSSPRSPRRSLTPRRRSRSPKRRSLSPKRRLLSPKQRLLSPKQRLPTPKQRSLSPKRKSSSPKRRSLSPRRRTISPRRRDKKELGGTPRNKPNIRDRLGMKSLTKSETKESKDKVTLGLSLKKDERPLDPILEARKRKFESKEIKVKEGVIRLKPKEETKLENTEAKVTDEKETKEEKQEDDEKDDKAVEKNKEKLGEEILNEDILLEDFELELEPKLDLFSDEESGSENEGRFKVKQEATSKPPVLSFTKLVNGTKKEKKDKPQTRSKEKKSTDNINTRSRSPSIKKNHIENPDVKHLDDSLKKSTKKRLRSDKSSVKNRIIMKSERHPTPKRFERKIEIKIKNPSKYEKDENPKHGKEAEERGGRKVELGIQNKSQEHDGDDDDFETEVIIDNDEDEVENTMANEGDLRAQLSKKRAEKLHKISAPQAVPSRLLQNALQNALQKSKKSKSQELSSSDGKLPIHLRLGIASNSEIFAKPKRKSRKRKSREIQDQV